MPQAVRKAVFPAAGGHVSCPPPRLSPKEMLPMVDKSLTQYVVEEAVASGIESVIIATSRRQVGHRKTLRRFDEVGQ